MTHVAYDPADILKENEALRTRLEEAEATLRAIRNGPQGDSVLGQEDISGRKQAEDKLRRSEQLHRIAFDLAPTGLVYCALDGRYINVNARMCEITGYTAAELLGMTIWDLTHPDDLARENELFPALLSGGTPDYANEKRYVRKDGSSRWVAVKARLVADDTGQPLHTVSVIRDIQDRKRTDAALHLSEIRYRRLFEAAHDGILILDPDTRKIVDANPFMTTLIGHPHEQLIGMELYQIGFLADAQASRDMFQKLKATRHVRYENLPLQSQQGGVRGVEVVANLYDEGGHPVVQCNVRDITERKRVELALRQHEERQAFLLKLSDTLGPLRDPFEVQTATMRLVVEHLDVNRASYFKIDPDQDGFSKTSSYDRGALPIPDHTRLSDFAPDMADGYRKGQTLFIEDAETEAATEVEREAYRAIGVRAGIGVPLVKDGLLMGIFGVHSSTPRHWTVAEVQLLKDVANRVWTAVDRAQAETQLRERQKFLDGIFKVLPGVLYIFDLDENRVVFVNNPADQTHSAEELAGMGADLVPNLMHPDDHQGFHEHIARIRTLKPGETAVFEYRMRDKADKWRWYMGSDTVFLRDEGGVAHQFIGVALEITDRKQAEAVQSENTRRQAFLLELSDALRAEPSAEAVVKRALQMLFDQMRLNRCYVGIYRLAEDTAEFPHQVHDDLLPPLPAQVRLSDFPKALQVASGGTLVIDDIVRMDGFSDSERANFTGLGMGALIAATLRKGENNPFWSICAVSASPRIWTPGEVSLVEEVAERTWAAVERAHAEERLQAAHDTFRQLVDRSPFGVYVINSNFRLVQMSDGGQKAFANVQQLIGRDFAEVVCAVWPDPFASKIIAHFRHTLASGEPFKAETDERRADINATEAYDWKIERIMLPDGGFGVVCHFYDLSERVRHEEHIKLLMGEVNHRSKNMLTIVQAIAKRTMATQPENFMERFGQRVQALVANQDLLVRNDWKAVSLGNLIGSQLAHFRDAHDIRVALDGPPVMITASASQALGMALHELATNAAKYGALSIKSGRVIISWNLLSDAAGMARFTLSWIESGGPLVAKPTRLGFGSTVIGSMIKMSLGCDAKIDFAPTGLIWRIDCLAAGLIEGSALSAPQSNGAAVKQEPAQDSGRHRVLVVEDEPLIAMDIAHTLSEAGYDVIGPASSVAQALALIAQSGCDAAVLDTNLGAETVEPVARELIRRGLPFIASSGYAREQQPEIMRTVPLLSKPLKPDMLIAEIVRCLGK